MKKIEMIDLLTPHQSILKEVEHAMTQLISTSTFIGGLEVTAFEEELALYQGIKHCISCANGTDALQIAMMAAGLKSGDEVIIPSFTYFATAEAAAILGLKPIFIEVGADTFNINSNELERLITSKTKAIIPVHLFGQCADMEAILKIAEKYNLIIIEDAAQSLGASYTFSNGETKMAGTMGDIGITSFYPSKNLGCFGDGGALFTNNDKIAAAIRMLCNHGQKERYRHDIIGMNSRLDSIQAAVLRIKLRHLNDYILARQEAALHYDKNLTNHSTLILPKRSKNASHVFNQYTIQVDINERDALVKFLAEKDIPTTVYYPIPIHLQKAFDYRSYKKGALPITEALCTKVISIPMHTAIDEEQLNYISTSILSYYN